MVGYWRQYQFAAARTLEGLRTDTLERVRLADVQAGQIDDFQLVFTSSVRAHQVKWSREPDTIGFAAFANDTAERHSYIRQLANGWKRLTTLHTPRRVIVHFVTNDLPSTHSQVPRPREVDDAPGSWHFAAFLAQAWAPASVAARDGRDPESAFDPRWRTAFQTLQDASGLTAAEWARFVGDCALELGQAAPEAITAAAPLSDGERRAWQRDVDALTLLFQRLVTAPDQRIDFARDELLRRLGWGLRVEFHNRHEFPEPEIPYHGIGATVAELTASVARFNQGYIMLLGSPGSGKSTLLTKTLLTGLHRVIRYYAYVPDAFGSNLRRGEASHFLHDVVLGLEREGVRVGATMMPEDSTILAQRFELQLGALHREWAITGRRTLIVVDGLDHIAREQAPERSLLRDLPAPERVPDGVLFVLGSQTDQLPDLSPRIRLALNQDGRRITMRPIDRDDVFAILDQAGLRTPLTPDDRERVFQLSAGHPLALNLIIRQLRQSHRPIADVLGDVEPFRDQIDTHYASLWAHVELNYSLVHLLALLARFRGPMRVPWMVRWAPREAIHQLTTQLVHYFNQERGQRWTFFHNSFRVFVTERTRNLIALGGEAALYAELADHCSGTSMDDPEYADELYYRARAGDDARVLALADPTTFRAQFVAGRPLSLIQADLDVALESAFRRRDIGRVTALLLAQAEFRQRAYYADLLPLAEVRIALGDVDLALDTIREGTALRVPRAAALRACADLDDVGLSEEARIVFRLAEPLDELRGTATVQAWKRQSADQDVDAWVEVAPRFRPLPEIMGIIDQTHVEADHFMQDRVRTGGGVSEDDVRARADQLASEQRRNNLFRRLANALDDMDRPYDADEVRAHLRGLGDEASGWWFWSMVDAWREAAADGTEIVERRFATLYGAVERHDLLLERLGSDASVALAEGFVRIRSDLDAARRSLSGMEQPEPVTRLSYSPPDEAFQAFARRFMLNRVLGALGDSRPVSAIVPDAAHDDDRLHVLFERAVVNLARLVGTTWMATLSPVDFLDRARPLVQLFTEAPGARLGGYFIGAARPDFYKFLITAAARCGRECIDVLRLAFDQEWSSPNREGVWPDALVRELVMEFYDVDAPREWTAAWLHRLEPVTFAGESLETELREAIAHVRAWSVVDDILAARETLARVLGASFGNEAKDVQLAACIDWAARANRADPAGSPERIRQVAAAVASLQGAEAVRYVAPRLLSAASEAGAPLATALVAWGFRHEVCGWTAGLTSLVEGIIEHAPGAAAAVSTFYRTLVLPFETGGEPDLVARVADALRHGHEDREFERLRHAIEVVAIGSARPALREALAGRAEEARELLRDPHVTDPTAPSYVIDAFDGLQLTVRELQQRVHTVDDVRDLVRRMRPDAYMYRWELILAPFLGEASPDDLVAVSDLLLSNDQTWRVQAAIAKRLIALRDPRAEAVARRVFAASSASGWHEEWDGGSRVLAFELLAQVAPAGIRDETWDALARDILGGNVGAREVFGSWARIAPLLIDEVPDVPIWERVSAHVAALVAYAPTPQAPVLPAATDPGDNELAAETLTRFAVTYLDHPAKVLAQGAQRFLVDRVQSGDVGARGALVARLADEQAPKDGALLVLRAMAGVGPESVSFASDALEQLRRADDYRDRRAVQELLEGLGERETIEDSRRVQHPLPAVFAIVHPPARWQRAAAVPGPGELLPPATNATELVHVFRDQLEAVARLAGVQAEALYQYVAELSGATPSSPSPPDEEPELRRELSGLGLEIAYRRPRPRRVERAMTRAVGMLVDRGWLRPEYFPQLDWLLRNADPALLILRPNARPPGILPIAERSASQYLPSTWVRDVSTERAAVGARQGDGGVILGEYTWLRWLDWKMATEVRVGVRIATGNGVVIDGSTQGELDDLGEDYDLQGESLLKDRVAVLDHLLIRDYAQREVNPTKLVVWNRGYRFETPGSPWLALNPFVARALGWRSTPEGLFRWVNAEGEVMAESVWWEDGFAGHRPPQFEEEVGFGWHVRASERGWPHISDWMGGSADWCRVERAAREQRAKAREGWRGVRAELG